MLPNTGNLKQIQTLLNLISFGLRDNVNFKSIQTMLGKKYFLNEIVFLIFENNTFFRYCTTHLKHLSISKFFLFVLTRFLKTIFFLFIKLNNHKEVKLIFILDFWAIYKLSNSVFCAIYNAISSGNLWSTPRFIMALKICYKVWKYCFQYTSK